MKPQPAATEAPRPGCRFLAAGFSLVEILVAAAVFALLALLVAGIVESGNTVISGSRKHLGADAEAREVFGRFGGDIARMPRRTDLDVLVSAANESLFFYSEAPGYQTGTNTREHNSLSLVGYRVNSDAQLDRLGKGLSWTNVPFLSYASAPLSTNSVPVSASTIAGAWAPSVGASPNFTDGTDSDYHALARGVFRMFVSFQKTDGSYALSPDTDALKGKLAGATAVVLTLAILDDDSRKIVADPTTLAGALPTPTQSDLNNKVLPAQLWQAAADNISKFAGDARIPESAASRVRIYQRSFPLNTQ